MSKSVTVLCSAERFGGKIYCNITVPFTRNLLVQTKKGLYEEFPDEKYTNQHFTIPPKAQAAYRKLYGF